MVSELAPKVDGFLKIGGVICDGKKNVKLCGSKPKGNMGAKISIIIGGKETFYEDQSQKSKDIYLFATSQLPRKSVLDVNRKADLTAKKLFAGDVTKAAILLTDKYEISHKYVSLAYKHRNVKGLKMAVSRGSNLELGRLLKVKKYPLVVYLERDDKEEEGFKVLGRLEGEGVKEIGSWLGKILGEEEGGGKGGKKKKRRK